MWYYVIQQYLIIARNNTWFFTQYSTGLNRVNYILDMSVPNYYSTCIYFACVHENDITQCELQLVNKESL